MENNSRPTFKFCEKTFSRSNHTYKYVAFEPPLEWLSDIFRVSFSSFDNLIAEIEAVIEGEKQEMESIGGERAICFVGKEVTECHDSQDGSVVYLDTEWLLRIFKEFKEFQRTLQ